MCVSCNIYVFWLDRSLQGITVRALFPLRRCRVFGLGSVPVFTARICTDRAQGCTQASFTTREHEPCSRAPVHTTRVNMARRYGPWTRVISTHPCSRFVNKNIQNYTSVGRTDSMYQAYTNMPWTGACCELCLPRTPQQCLRCRCFCELPPTATNHVTYCMEKLPRCRKLRPALLLKINSISTWFYWFFVMTCSVMFRYLNQSIGQKVG